MSIMVFISRIFGFLRDVILAAFFGTSTLADAYFLAYRIPNTLRSLLGEGAFNSAFIPVYSGYVSKDDKTREGLFLGNLFLRFSFVLFLVSLAGALLSPYIIKAITVFAPDNHIFRDNATGLLRITFWYLILVGISAFFMGVQQSHNSFARPAAGQIFYNITFILILLMLFKEKDQIRQIYIAAWGVIGAGGVQMLSQWYFSSRLKRPFKFNLKEEKPAIKRLVKIITPAIFGQAIIEINLIADNLFAVMLSSGVISAMYYSTRLMQLPMGIFAVSIATVSLTIFSRKVSKGESPQKELQTSFNSLMYVILPVSSYLMAAGIYPVKALFQRGEFDLASSTITASLLTFYAAGIIFYSLSKLFGQVFYAYKQVKYPVIFTSVAMLINIELNMIFIRYMGASGLALASALSAAVNVVFLWIYLKKMFGLTLNISKMIKLIPAFAVSYFLLKYFGGHLNAFFTPIMPAFFANTLISIVLLMINMLPYMLFVGPSKFIRIFRKRGI